MPGLWWYLKDLTVVVRDWFAAVAPGLWWGQRDCVIIADTRLSRQFPARQQTTRTL
ncbi:hypothetical protein M2280_005946 [Prescottella agglutinans]|uniref:Uncharacterized protein n=1 Tax=Prescottella agglutinans TaxID=1644129 RepID=A0ABT6MK61_9NOCA|nr:hypothetical protein [Prescottella agglutinans]